MKTIEEYEEEMGLCNNCARPISLDSIRHGKCSHCDGIILPWEIKFTRSLHSDIPRKLYEHGN